MSAFIVNDETICALARAFVDYRVDYHDGTFQPQFLVFKDKELKRIGQSLLDQNYKSVNFRYNENTEIPEFEYKEVYIDEGIVYGCIACYEYQACETRDWEKSDIYMSLRSLEHELLVRLLRKNRMVAPYGYGGHNILED